MAATNASRVSGLDVTRFGFEVHLVIVALGVQREAQRARHLAHIQVAGDLPPQRAKSSRVKPSPVQRPERGVAPPATTEQG